MGGSQPCSHATSIVLVGNHLERRLNVQEITSYLQSLMYVTVCE